MTKASDAAAAYVGRSVMKAFAAPEGAAGSAAGAEPEMRMFSGTVDRVAPSGPHYIFHITYEDGDEVRRFRAGRRLSRARVCVKGCTRPFCATAAALRSAARQACAVRALTRVRARS
jgi:hypothetical protein